MAKKAETLYQNLNGLISRVGIGRVGFSTFTFKENLADGVEAGRRFRNFKDGVLRREFGSQFEYIAVVEPQARGAVHFHVACSFGLDVRTGFDFDALARAVEAKRDGDMDTFRYWERVYFRSANGSLRRVWSVIRDKAARYGFGRVETLPVRTNAQGVARYIGAYVAPADCSRIARDCRLRTVRYGLSERTASIKWMWVDGGGRVWRRGCQLLGLVLEKSYDELSEAFRHHGWYRNRKLISLLGDKYEEALACVAKIPEWADYPSRVRFLAHLWWHLAGRVGDPAGFLRQLHFEREQPF